LIGPVAADRIVLHLDMDAFYASVEQRESPELRGRSVIVGADPEAGEGRGVVAAASYEARKYGVHSAQPISQAWRNCPEGEYVRPDFDLYEKVSRNVFGVVREHVDVLEPVSIDEAYADVTARVDGFEDARELAETIRSTVREATGLTCSVGVAPNKLVAKIASDEDKPDGLTVVEPGRVRGFLDPREATVIAGVGPKTYETLQGLGIETVAELAGADPAQLEQALGSWGPELAERAMGRDDRPVDPSWDRKSVGAERTFGEDRAPEDARERLDRVAATAARRLQNEGHQARTVLLKLRLTPFETFTRQRKLPAPADDEGTIQRIARGLFDEASDDRKVRLVGVRLSDLVKDSPQQARLDRWPADVLGEADDGPRWEDDAYWRFA
jgi:nucleotidyltransferase/DNA polymerase involved in DNA repair